MTACVSCRLYLLRDALENLMSRETKDTRFHNILYFPHRYTRKKQSIFNTKEKFGK